jgi:hypothetical protein
MLYVLYTIALLVLAFLSAFFVAALVNLALKTPPLRYVISSALNRRRKLFACIYDWHDSIASFTLVQW